MCDAATGRRDGLGFSQPISYDQLTPVSVLPLSAPTAECSTRLRTRAGRQGAIQAQFKDGRCHIKWDDQADGQDPELVDLARLEYQWL